MKIEAGKFYRTKGGSKAQVYATNGGGSMPVHGALQLDDGSWSIVQWTRMGWFFLNPGCDEDLESEWIDRPKMDWSALPRWAKWIASNVDGYWYWYAVKPVIDQSCFYFPCSICGDIPREYAPKWSGDWKDSLTEVPRKD